MDSTFTDAAAVDAAVGDAGLSKYALMDAACRAAPGYNQLLELAGDPKGELVEYLLVSTESSARPLCRITARSRAEAVFSMYKFLADTQGINLFARFHPPGDKWLDDCFVLGADDGASCWLMEVPEDLEVRTMC